MAMSKKNYELIAYGFFNSKPELSDSNDFQRYMKVKLGWVMAMEGVAEQLANDNVSFDREKFYKACGYDA